MRRPASPGDVDQAVDVAAAAVLESLVERDSAGRQARAKEEKEARRRDAAGWTRFLERLISAARRFVRQILQPESGKVRPGPASRRGPEGWERGTPR